MPPLTGRGILGVPEGADANEVKAAYRRLAKLIHPDANESGAATEMMRIVNLAYEEASGNGLASKQPARKAAEGCTVCEALVTFGKYEDLTVEDVLDEDPRYVAWLISKFSPGGWREIFQTAVNHAYELQHGWTADEREAIRDAFKRYAQKTKEKA